MKRTLLLFVLIVIISGCATTQMLKPDDPPDITPDTNTALLVIIRNTGFGGKIVFWNYLDGKFIGETMGNTYFITRVTPGEHFVVSETENTGVAHLNFQAGKRYFLRQGVVLGVWRARTSGFSPMSINDAMEAMEDCDYLQLDTSTPFPDMDPTIYKKAIEEYHTGVKENSEGYKDLLNYTGE